MNASVRTTAAALLLLAALLSPREGLAKVSRSVLRPGGDFGSSVAVGSDGTVHVLYLSRARRLRHAWIQRGRRHDEAVDTISEAVYGNSSAVDSQGRVHVAYDADRTGLGGAGTLVHAVRDGSGWTLTELGPGGQAPSLAIGAGDLPRILNVGAASTQYLSFNGSTWDTEDVGVFAHGFMGTSLVLDAQGHAHATLGLNTQLYYATDASGSWVGTPLGSGGASAGVALDPLERPQVLAAFNSGVAVPSLVHFRDEGSGFQGEVLFDSTTGAIPDRVALAADGKGGLFALVSLTVNAPGRSVEVVLGTFFDGFEWRGKGIDLRNRGFEVSLARGPDGSYHGTYRDPVGGDQSQVIYARIRLPDLEASWDAVDVVPVGAARTLEGTLRLRNAGPAASRPVRISFFLSGDDVLDPADERLDADLRVGSIRPGREKTVPVSLGPLLAPPGTRVLVAVDADVRIPDTNRLDNVLPVPLFE